MSQAEEVDDPTPTTECDEKKSPLTGEASPWIYRWPDRKKYVHQEETTRPNPCYNGNRNLSESCDRWQPRNSGNGSFESAGYIRPKTGRETGNHVRIPLVPVRSPGRRSK